MSIQLPARTCVTLSRSYVCMMFMHDLDAHTSLAPAKPYCSHPQHQDRQHQDRHHIFSRCCRRSQKPHLIVYNLLPFRAYPTTRHTILTHPPPSLTLAHHHYHHCYCLHPRHHNSQVRSCRDHVPNRSERHCCVGVRRWHCRSRRFFCRFRSQHAATWRADSERHDHHGHDTDLVKAMRSSIVW
jgi:hypothetical protein